MIEKIGRARCGGQKDDVGLSMGFPHDESGEVKAMIGCTPAVNGDSPVKISVRARGIILWYVYALAD